MPGNDPGATVFVMLIYGSIQNEVERANHSLNAAAVFHIDKWILRGREDVAGDNHIGTPEMDNTVAVRRCVRHGEDLYRFPVVVLPSSIFKVGIAGRSIQRWFLFLHSRLNVLVSNNRRSLPGIGKLIREKRTR